MARSVLGPLEAAGLPAASGLVRLLLNGQPGRCTLLAVCPNSETVARAALRAAREADAPLLLAATLNQVDRDGGYTGWTPAGLRDYVAREAERLRLDTPVLLCLDHGGPWQKDTHVLDGYTHDATLAEVKASIEACIDAGYVLLHVDPTVDRSGSHHAPPGEVVARTIDLIAHAEAYRRDHGGPPLSYEVGNEEIDGGLSDPEVLGVYMEQLEAELRERGLEGARPAFVVGRVGTELQSRHFEPKRARLLAMQVKPYGALLKGHYTDFVDNPEAYPLSGMGGANVGPEFTDVEYRTLMELTALERRIGAASGLEAVLEEAVRVSGRWRKWLRPAERDQAFSSLPDVRRRWLLRTSARYVWTHPDVAAARQRLYDNLKDVCDADAFVVWRVQTAVLRYYHRFNLIRFNERLAGALHAFDVQTGR